MSSFTRPYARAFLEAAPPGYDIARFLEAGQTMANAFLANPSLRAFLLAPNVPREAKSKALAALSGKAGLDEYGARFLQVLLRNHRLLEAEKKTVEDAIARRTGMTVQSQIDLDPKLLGGFIARAGSRVFDGSVAAAIRRFQTQVKDRTGA